MIKNIKMKLSLTSVAILFLLAACIGVNESFKQGQDFANNNRWEEALQYYQKAVSEEPDNQQYKDALAGARHQVAKARLGRAKQSFASAGDNFVSLERLAKEADTLLAMDANDADIKNFAATVKGKISDLKGNLASLYLTAEQDMQREDWLAAMDKLKKINEVFPNYEDTVNGIKRCQSEGARFLYQQAVNLSKEEDWKAAAETYKQAMELNPSYLDVSKQYQAALQKDNPKYYTTEAAKAEVTQKWDRALLLYERAIEYPQANADLNKKLADLKTKVANIYFEESIARLKEEKLYDSHKRIELARKHLPAIQESPQYVEQTSHLFAALMKRADKYIEKEMWGNALIWLQKVESLNPDYPELFQKMNDVKDPINRRVRKSIAVFDFGTPSAEKDAGRIAANKLIAFLHKNASVDLRIIERENLQSILREMQLSQTGLVDIKTAQSVGKMRGIDTFIMGDVLQYNHKYTDNPSVNQVKVMVDEEDVRNPEFSDWLIRYPRPSEQDLKNAPPRTIKKKNYQLIPNKQGVARITAMLEISFKLVDTQTGEIIANTVSGKLIKEDKYQEGLPMAKIAHDPLELPTEIEVIDELTNEKISEMGRHVLKHYQSLELEYFNKGQDLQKRRNYEAALEKYIDAVYDEKLKGIATPISQKSSELIDMITKYY